ncbi:MAG: hypothetical protein I3273_07360 [Candidatus Moeniiplasma glomeromycotorum]|nr:hypothetical protein [Candidatus Moeniiplasma glomeromycotorum]MCE8168372.1 hypothetical protein [Candidatus Moeniiplasma glomeromycotorum]MCE8169904.1 hypothetical protein [Candidatus Moeniiplasma glomeromycotorum]
MKDKKVNFTISIHQKKLEELRKLVPSGTLSDFIENLIDQGIQDIKKKIATEYQSAANDPSLNNRLQKWSNFRSQNEKKN